MADPAGEHEQLHHVLRGTLTVAWWMVYPIGVVVWYLVIALITLLKLLYHPVAFVLLPFVYVGRFLLAVVVWPFHFAAKFKTLYIYLGVAAIVGLAGGLVVGGIYLWFHKLLRLEKRKEARKARTAKQYREEKRRQKLQSDDQILPADYASSNVLSPASLSPGYLSLSDSARKGKRPRGLLSQIMEEQDSDF